MKLLVLLLLVAPVWSQTLTPPTPARPPVRSIISIYDTKSRSVRVLYEADQHYEAPNWSPDGRYLLINGGGKLYRLPLAGGSPQPVDLGDLAAVNNDHGISPDGKHYAISARGPEGGSEVYVTNSQGGERRRLSTKAPSYFHGWSPDGQWLAFTSKREADYNLYRVAVTGGPEQQLTADPGYDDGPDYSPDGKWIYFNSERAEGWDLYRIPATGAGPGDKLTERLTRDAYEDWFPHLSPNGKQIVFISFEKGTKGHPSNQNVVLRMMPANGKGEPQIIQRLFGGQGTMNVNSWAPDSRKFAFVSYQLK